MRHEDLTSPCINLCVMDDANGYCIGCWRTLEEIAGWIDFAPARKREVLARLEARRAGAELSH